MMRTVRAAACVAALLTLSCSGPMVAAVGESNDVVLVHGAGAGEAARALDAALSAESLWLVGEPEFQTTVVSVDEFGELTNRRHIALVGTWDDPEMARLVRSRIGELRPGDPPRPRVVEDIWARGQVVLTVMADSRPELADYIAEHAADIVERLDAAARDRLTRNLRELVAESGIVEEMERRFGWSLCPPSGYDLFTGNEGDGLVFFRRVRPDRTVYVYWREGSPVDVTQEFVVTKRNEIGSLFFDGDEIEWQRDFIVERVEFAGVQALCVSGWWGNHKLVGGGPFRTYCFFEPSQQRVYLVDAALFAPGLNKTALVRNLDATLRTFRAVRS